MDLATVQWLGVLVSTIVVFVSGLTWFSPRAFYPAWSRAMGRTGEAGGGDGDGSAATLPSGLLFGLTLVGIVAQATAMSLLLQVAARETGAVDLPTGAGMGLVVGAAIAAASLGHRLFAGHGLRAWLLEVGNDVLNFVLMGAILSFFH